MGHTHTFAPSSQDPPRRHLATVLAVVVGTIAVATAIGVVVLWPNSKAVPHDQNPYNNPGVSIIDATVKAATPLECGSGGQGPDGLPEVAGKCAKCR